MTSVVAGCDRVAANGDTANKIGTYSLAVLARHHGIPFYIAMPLSTLDRDCPSGAHIPIEERPGAELFSGLEVVYAGFLGPGLRETIFRCLSGILRLT